MKKIIILLFALVLVSGIKAQTIFSHTTTITLTNTETGVVYLSFYGNKKTNETLGFSTGSANPANQVEWTGDLELNFRADSSTATTEYDSLAGYVIPLNHEGRPKADTLFFDWENFTASADSTVEYTAWVPSSSPAYDNRPDFSINLTNKIEPAFGIEIGFIQKAVSHTSIITLNSIEVKQ